MNKKLFSKILALTLILYFQACSPVNENTKDVGTATYLGNEGLMISHGDKKILFDPFFHNAYNNYQLVPEDIRNALFSGLAPYNDIDAIFISHAHGDHFSASDLVKFLEIFPNTQLIAPKQAIDVLIDIEDAQHLNQQMHVIDLEYQDAPLSNSLNSISYDVVRIPHAGWPQPERAAISNLVFRVTLNDSITVVHMGDADPNDVHFAPLIEHWDKRTVDTAFPPYWFMTSADGRLILQNRIKATENIGVHVPVSVPVDLVNSGEKYFTEQGKNTVIHPK